MRTRTGTDPRGGMSRVLLLGADGMLGTAWRRLLDEQKLAYSAPLIKDFDLTRSDSVETGIDGAHSLVVNCAGFTDVDGAVLQESVAMELNGAAVGQLARRGADVGALLVHYSTDYVFSGDKSEPLVIEETLLPLNAYGRSKALGEALVRIAGGRHMIVRTSWLYAAWGKNFVRTVSSRLTAGIPLKVVTDQVGRPTSARHLAAATLELVRRDALGTWHVTDGGQCSWFELAVAIARHIGSGCHISPCGSAEYPSTARRPMFSVLDISKTEELLGPMPECREGLAEVLSELQVREARDAHRLAKADSK